MFIEKIKTGINKVFNLFSSVVDDDSSRFSEIKQVEQQIAKENKQNENDQFLRAFNAYYGIDFDSIPTNKLMRLKVYRQMSTYPEVGYALDEIASSVLNKDENGNFINLVTKNIEKTEISAEIQRKFNKFIELFEFEENIYSYMHKLLTEGELVFENIVNTKSIDSGIIGVNEIKNENFEFLVNKANNNQCGIAYYPDVNNEQPMVSQTSSLGNPATFNRVQTPGTHNYGYGSSGKREVTEFLPVPWPQITYISSGNFNETQTIVYPLLEKIRKTYIQLVLLEECAIVYRVARSPERLLFNVSTGKLPRQKANEEILKLMLRFKTRKGGSMDSGSIYNRYDSINALESFFFAKPDGTEGTTVDRLSASASFSELQDVEYFLKKLYLGLNVPFTRINDSKSNYNQFVGEGSGLSYEEFRFAKFIIRIQNAIASGLKNSFITHLKLTGMWDKFGLTSHKLNIQMVKPSIFDLFIEQQLIKTKFATYRDMASQPEFSTTYLQEKILKWSTTEIELNMKKKIHDELLKVKLEQLLKNKTGVDVDLDRDIMPGMSSSPSPIPSISPSLPEPKFEPEPSTSNTPEISQEDQSKTEPESEIQLPEEMKVS